MILDSRSSISDFLSATAAKQPTPGGGAVAALCGATAAAIGEMVLNYSIHRKTSAEFDASLAEAIKSISRVRLLMLGLLVEDQQAYAAYTDAKKLPDTDPDKSAAQARATLLCVAVPQEIASASLAILQLAERVLPMCNRWLISDLAVACELAMATLRCALHNIRANLGGLDAAARADVERQAGLSMTRGVEIIVRVMPQIRAVMNQV